MAWSLHSPGSGHQILTNFEKMMGFSEMDEEIDMPPLCRQRNGEIHWNSFGFVGIYEAAAGGLNGQGIQWNSKEHLGTPRNT